MALSPHMVTARSVEITKGLAALPENEAVFADQSLETTLKTRAYID